MNVHVSKRGGGRRWALTQLGRDVHELLLHPHLADGEAVEEGVRRLVRDEPVYEHPASLHEAGQTANELRVLQTGPERVLKEG